MRPPRTILILAGPTGGHLFPAWAFAEALKKKCTPPGCRLILATGMRAKHLSGELARGPFDAVVYLRDFTLQFWPPWKTLALLGNLLGAFWQSLCLIGQEKPQLVAGFGSYTSVPGVLVANWKAIPVLLHEQNKVAGKATRFLMKLLRRKGILAASFEETVPVPGKGWSWTVVGLPVRSPLTLAAACFERSFDRKPLTLLVTGGSQGARRLNQLVVQALLCLTPAERENLAVIHITGKFDYERVRKDYETLKLKCDIHPFFDKMHELFQQADFAVTRAGANTLFELALLGLPALVVPYPHAGGHQTENALQFEKSGAVLMHAEEKLSANVLARYLQVFMQDSVLRQKLSSQLKRLSVPRAAFDLAEMAKALLED